MGNRFVLDQAILLSGLSGRFIQVLRVQNPVLNASDLGSNQYRAAFEILRTVPRQRYELLIESRERFLVLPIVIRGSRIKSSCVGKRGIEKIFVDFKVLDPGKEQRLGLCCLRQRRCIISRIKTSSQLTD